MEGLINLFLGLGAVCILLVVVFYILYAVGLLKMFHKMGEPGWKAFIPYVNSYTMYARTWEAKYFWIQFALMVAVPLIKLLLGSGTILSVVRGAAGIAGLVIKALSCDRQSKAFDCGLGMAVVLFFFPSIATMIIGFGQDYEYIGPQKDAN